MKVRPWLYALLATTLSLTAVGCAEKPQEKPQEAPLVTEEVVVPEVDLSGDVVETKPVEADLDGLVLEPPEDDPEDGGDG